MENIDKIKTLLNRYIDEYNSIREEINKCITSKELYEDLLGNLDYDNIQENKDTVILLLTTLYKDDIYSKEYYNLLLIKDANERNIRFKRLYKNISNDYNNIIKRLDELNLRVFRNRYIYQSAKRAAICLEHSLPIKDNKYDTINIKKILDYYETIGVISNKEELLLINEIELYNRKVFSSSRQEEKEQNYTDAIYSEIPNILNAGYQKHDVIEVDDDRKIILDKFVKQITGFINDISKEELLDNIELYRNYNIQDNEYNYILTKLLDNLQDSMLTFYELLIEKEIYTNKYTRLDAIKNYYNLLDKYLLLRKYYDEINIFTVEDINESSNVEKEEKCVIYSHSPNSSKARLISDMKDIPHEYYSRVYDLIDRFKSGNLTKEEFKKLTNNHRLGNLFELRDDQIRIVLKHIEGNLYCIMGAATKKDDNDMHMYNTMFNRFMPKTNTKENMDKELSFATIVNSELEKLVKEKGRKGNR